MSDPAAYPWAECSRPGQQSGHYQASIRPVGELQLVDLSHQSAVWVDDLSIKQVEGRVVSPARDVFAHHCPAFVKIIKGIAASAAASTITRYTLPSALATRPFTFSPM